MNLTAPELLLAGCFLPLLALIVYGHIKLKRQAAELERNGGIEPPYAPVEPPAAGSLLRRFNAPQRAQITRQKALVRMISLMIAWLLLLAMTGGLLPASIAQIDLGQGPAMNIGHSFLKQILLGSTMSAIFPLFCALLAMAELIIGSSAQFLRTRPISRSFIYWNRVLPTLAAMIGGFVLAAVLSWLILLACYGPVYHHLDDAGSTQSPVNLIHPGEAFRTYLTSAPRLFLSLLTTMLLVFSFTVALLLQPIRLLRNKVTASVLVWLGIMSFSVIAPTAGLIAPHYARFFFLYNRLGPPPGYIHALVPLTLTVLFLVLASFFYERLEI